MFKLYLCGDILLFLCYQIPMYFNWFKKRIFLVGSAVLLVILSITGIIWISLRTDSKHTLEAEKAFFDNSFKALDTACWQNPHKSLVFIHGLIKLSNNINDSNTLAMCLYYKSVCFSVLDEFDSIIAVCNLGIDISKKVKNETAFADIENVFANYYLVKNDFYNANCCLMKAMPVFEKQNRIKELSKVLNSFGLLYSWMKDQDKAITYFNRVIDLLKNSSEKRMEAIANLNMANCYYFKNDYVKMISFLQKAIVEFSNIKDSIHLMSCYMDMGIAYNEMGDPKKGPENYYKAMEFAKRGNKRLLYGNTLLDIGVYYSDKDLVKAKKYFMHSLAEYSSIGNKNGEMHSYLELSKIGRKETHWKQAFEYFQKYTSINDSIVNNDLVQKIADIREKYNLQKKENEKIAFQKKYELKKKETIILILSFTTVFLVIIVVAAFVKIAYNSLRKSNALKTLQIDHLQDKMHADERIAVLEKLRLEAEIDGKNKELTTTALQLITKNDVLTKISSISESFYMRNAVSEDYFTGLKNILKENLDQEKDWQHFKKIFEEVHDDFFKKIKQICPELSENELRICAYLKINFQNKEIAKLLNITPESLKTLRYRIRKKLTLDKDEILEEFIRSL
jgi:tetratricopeptide (TPR) repeat protein